MFIEFILSIKRNSIVSIFAENLNIMTLKQWMGQILALIWG